MKRNKLGVLISTAAVVIVTLGLAGVAFAQHSFKELYQFPGDETGFQPPNAAIIFDAAGNVYGNLVEYDYSTGMVYRLMPNPDGSWTMNDLYEFTGGADGGSPQGVPAFDASGNLYGTTVSLFGGIGANLVFKLAPNPDGTWTESVLYTFSGGADGGSPLSGVILDAAGNLYGTTSGGGASGAGTVFKLAPNPDGTWTESVLYSFSGGSDGGNPNAGLIFDAAGNLYGATPTGGAGAGVVFKLTPNPDGTWTEGVLFTFAHTRDGADPEGGLTFDVVGNLYGTTRTGGSSNGTVFQLRKNPDDSWTERVLYRFSGGSDGCHPQSGVTTDSFGNLYGTTRDCGDNGYGVAFQLKRHKSGSWTLNVLNEFNSGIGPNRMIFDPSGNLYGTTCCGGSYGYGNLFEIVR